VLSEQFSSGSHYWFKKGKDMKFIQVTFTDAARTLEKSAYFHENDQLVNGVYGSNRRIL
jgi:hypothetical protein